MSSLGRELIRRLVILLLVLTGFLLVVFTDCSPKSKSLQTRDFGDIICQFM